MRLQEITKILESLIPVLTAKVENTKDANSKIMSGHVKAIIAVLEIENIGIMNNSINQIKAIESIFMDRTNRIVVTVTHSNSFLALLRQIRESCSAIVELSNITMKKHNETTLSIKLPELCDLKQLSKFIEKLDKSMNQLVSNQYTNGKVELTGVESGSMWVNIDVGTISNVVLVGTAVWSAAVIRKKVYEGNIIKSKVESLNIQNESLKIIKDGLEKEVNAVCDTEAKYVLKENGIDEYENDYLERVKYTIRMFAEIINEGAQIHHSLLAPEKVANLFPDFNKIDAVESKVLQIEKSDIG